MSGSYDIYPYTTPDRWNFDLSYVLSDSNVADVASFQSLTTITPQVELSNQQVGLSVGATTSLVFNINVLLDFITCEAIRYLCLMVTSPEVASYVETSLENNLLCYDLTANVECYPGRS